MLNAAACVIFLLSGADKAATLQEVLENKNADLPSQKVCPANGKLIWVVDEPAARTLSRPTPLATFFERSRRPHGNYS